MASTISGPQVDHAGVDDGTARLTALESYGSLGGRILLSQIFLVSGVIKLLNWSEVASMMQAHGLLFPTFFLVVVVIIELLGGLSILLGFQARMGALVLFLYLIPVTITFHNFWAAADAMEQQNQMQHFLKNLALMGGLLLVAGLGPGAISLDASQKRDSAGLRRPDSQR